MTELDFIIDLHLNSERQGPGSEADTIKALEFTDLLEKENLNIADIGCGSGGQTKTLAKYLKGSITAVDLFPAFLNELEAKAKSLGIDNRIKTLACPMEELPFEENAFDLIFSEGAIYNIGFENGIKQWRKFLKPGGFLAVSEITWITNERPLAIEEFWQNEYPEISQAHHKIAQLEANGYSIRGYFKLPPESWIEHYYNPMVDRFNTFLERNKHHELAKKVVEDNKAEIELYLKYQDYYSYGFYIASKN